jgi:hypothetical protein
MLASLLLSSLVGLSICLLGDYIIHQILLLQNCQKLNYHKLVLINLFDVLFDFYKQIKNRDVPNSSIFYFIPFVLICILSELSILLLNLFMFCMIIFKIFNVFMNDNYNIVNFDIKSLYYIGFIMINFNLNNIIFIILYFFDVDIINL